MKRYKLRKDLPIFKAGDEFFISEKGNLIARTPENPKKVIVGKGDSIVPIEIDLMVYAKETLKQFPNILTDWFEEVGIDQDKLRQIIDTRDKEASARPDLPIESKISLLDKFITGEFERFIDCEIDQQEFFKKAKDYRVSRAKLLRKFYKEAKKQQK